MARKPADQSVSREDIILAAADVLHRSGYDATTMKDIAAEVNLTAASLYHHFRNKDALVLAVLEAGLEQVIAQMEPIAQSDQSTIDKLTAMIRCHVTNVTDNTSVGAAMIFEIRSLMSKSTDAARRDAFFARRDYFEGLFHRVMQDGISNGELRPVDAAIAVKTLMGANNWVAVWYKEGGRLDGKTIAGMIAENFLKGIKA